MLIFFCRLTYSYHVPTSCQIRIKVSFIPSVISNWYLSCLPERYFGCFGSENKFSRYLPIHIFRSENIFNQNNTFQVLFLLRLRKMNIQSAYLGGGHSVNFGDTSKNSWREIFFFQRYILNIFFSWNEMFWNILGERAQSKKNIFRSLLSLFQNTLNILTFGEKN